MNTNIAISRSVLFVPGIWTSERKMKKTPWKDILTHHGYSVDIIYGWYATHYHEHHKNIVAEIIDWMTKNPNGIIIAHSFGGILTRRALRQLSKETEFNGIIFTLASPHTAGILLYPTITRNDLKPCDNRFYSYGGYADIMVPFVFTKAHITHKNFLCAHEDFLRTRRIIHRIVDDLNNVVESKNPRARFI